MRKTVLASILVLTVLASMASNSMAYRTAIKVSEKNIVIDVAHGSYHTEADNFVGNLTEAGNTVTVVEENDTLTLADDVDALFMSNFDDYEDIINYLGEIKEWFDLGGKFLFIGADSDYGGYHNHHAANVLLGYLGSDIFFASESIEDPEMNDGAAYRAAAYVYGDTPVAKKLDQKAGFILHGPTAICGLNRTAGPTAFYDLRDYVPEDVEILVSFGADAVAIDSDLSESPYDVYEVSDDANNVTGNYPGVVYQKFNTSHLVIAGEAMFTDYKKMYDQNTEQAAEGYNEGLTYGMKFVNDMVNFFLSGANVPVSFVPVIAALGLFGAILVIQRKKK